MKRNDDWNYAVGENCNREGHAAAFPAFEAEERGVYKDDSATLIKCAIAAKHKAQNWRVLQEIRDVFICGDPLNRTNIAKHPIPTSHEKPLYMPPRNYRLPLASNQGNHGSIPSGIVPGSSRVRVMPDDAAGRWFFFPGSSCFPAHCIPALLLTHLVSPSSALKTSMGPAATPSTFGNGQLDCGGVALLYRRIRVKVVRWNSRGCPTAKVWSNTGVQERGKREISDKTRRPAASSGTIPTCENMGGGPAGSRTRFTLVWEAIERLPNARSRKKRNIFGGEEGDPQPTAAFAMFPACETLGVTSPGFETEAPSWEVAELRRESQITLILSRAQLRKHR
ncbi:hypothetical protein PR048_004469 [Dryococelus australis]|uniref:Uncharacterized protein n=1 Tax=Dryococelus australis TaxID=614101 RepID=A0ABQ9I5I7_9NEOP|nr:hypothetical protein PR048_004469 [Dryococelus australis]